MEKPSPELLEVLAAGVRHMTNAQLLIAREAVASDERDHPDTLAVFDREIERRHS